MNTSMNRWSALSLVILLSLSTTGCSFFADKFDNLRSRNTDEQPAVQDPTAVSQEQQAVAATPAAETVEDETVVAQQEEPQQPDILPLDIDDRVLVQQIQAKLNLLGFDAGTPDGVAGPKTLMALARFRDMAGVLSNPELGDMLQEVVAANEAGVEQDKPWWQRRLPASGNPDEASLTAESESMQPSAAITTADEQSVDTTAQADTITTQEQVVATAEQLRVEQSTQSSEATSAPMPIINDVQSASDQSDVGIGTLKEVSIDRPEANADTEVNSLEIPPSVGVSVMTAEQAPALASRTSSTDLGELNQDALEVNKRLVGNGIAGTRSNEGDSVSTAMVTDDTIRATPATVESIDLSALAPAAIGVSRSTEPESRTFVSRVRGAWDNTKAKVRSRLSRDNTTTVDQGAETDVTETIDPDIH